MYLYLCFRSQLACLFFRLDLWFALYEENAICAFQIYFSSLHYLEQPLGKNRDATVLPFCHLIFYHASMVSWWNCGYILDCVFSISDTICLFNYFIASCRTFVSHLVYSAGVTVKSIVKGSTVDQDGRIHIGDIILSVSAKKNISRKQKMAF